MARYKIVLMATAANIRQIQKKAMEAFGTDISHQVTKIENGPSRADRLADAQNMFEDSKSVLEELRDEIQSWKDNLPESLQDGDKASELEECASALEEIVNKMDDISFDDVSFPSMM